MPEILGIALDDVGRCQHWHQHFDIIANRCQQCQKYFACALCHDQLMSHKFKPIPMSKIGVMCGACHLEMTGDTYVNCVRCPTCQHDFNPRCQLHHDIYFC
ncbi:CHY zinc finger protein [uncultured Leuconostoc sp.]|uniref:CHY zinc finger protein n=1 Tax=uncultured Leuconostoc sp. TaxID=173262 RepID=UPI0025E3EB3E|nr:CHY zinc finger protein [uncultured Leuconostoc sp.]